MVPTNHFIDVSLPRLKFAFRVGMCRLLTSTYSDPEWGNNVPTPPGVLVREHQTWLGNSTYLYHDCLAMKMRACVVFKYARQYLEHIHQVFDAFAVRG